MNHEFLVLPQHREVLANERIFGRPGFGYRRPYYGFHRPFYGGYGGPFVGGLLGGLLGSALFYPPYGYGGYGYPPYYGGYFY